MPALSVLPLTPHQVETLLFREALESLTIRGYCSPVASQSVVNSLKTLLRCPRKDKSLDDLYYEFEELVEKVFPDANTLLDEGKGKETVVAVIRTSLGPRFSSNPDYEALVEEIYQVAFSEKRFPRVST